VSRRAVWIGFMLVLSLTWTVAQAQDSLSTISPNMRGALARGTTIEGQLELAQYDAYTFEAVRSEMLVFTTPVRDFRPALSFRQPDGTPLPAGLIAHPDIVTSPQWLFIAPESGTYTAVVGVDPTISSGDGAYGLRVEPKTLANPRLLTFGVPVEDALDAAATVDNFDLYLIREAAGVPASIRLTMAEETDNSAALLLLDRYGRPMLMSAPPVPTSSPRIDFVMGDDFYFIFVRAHGAANGYGGAYTLAVDRIGTGIIVPPGVGAPNNTAPNNPGVGAPNNTAPNDPGVGAPNNTAPNDPGVGAPNNSALCVLPCTLDFVLPPGVTGGGNWLPSDPYITPIYINPYAQLQINPALIVQQSYNFDQQQFNSLTQGSP